eukprot:s13_g3.t1
MSAEAHCGSDYVVAVVVVVGGAASGGGAGAGAGGGGGGGCGVGGGGSSVAVFVVIFAAVVVVAVVVVVAFVVLVSRLVGRFGECIFLDVPADDAAVRMSIMRHEAFHRHASSLNTSEWRIPSIFLHWLALAWLLYFLVLAVLTAVYFAARRRIARLLWKNSFLPNPEAAVFRSAAAEEKVGKHAHCRRFSAVPMGDDEPDPSSLEIVQSGYRTWWFGFLLRCLWLLVPVASQIQLAWLTWEQYFGLGWDHAAKQFLLIYVVSHLVLFLATRFSGQVKTFFLQPSSLASLAAELPFVPDPKKGLSELELVRVRHMDEHDGHESEEGEGRFYQHTCVRYLWSSQARRFRPSGTLALSGEESYQALDRGGLPSEMAKERLAKQGSNAINVKVVHLGLSLLELLECGGTVVLPCFRYWCLDESCHSPAESTADCRYGSSKRHKAPAGTP